MIHASHGAARRVRTHRPLLHAAGARAALGVGDDCALLAPAPGHDAAISSDMLVEGRHFVSTVAPGSTRPQGARGEPERPRRVRRAPLAFTLSLALPTADEAFLAPFAQGLSGSPSATTAS
jgi:thiamine-monophosphate kinase